MTRIERTSFILLLIGVVFGWLLIMGIEYRIEEDRERLNLLTGEIQNLSAYLSEVEKKIDSLREEVEEMNSTLQEVYPVAQSIASINPTLTTEDLWSVSFEVYKASIEYEVDWRLIVAVGRAESDWRLEAKGRYGEMGPLQVLPSTFEWMGGEDITNWRETFNVGVRYLKMSLDRSNDITLAVARYNSGINRSHNRAMSLSGRYANKVISFVGDLNHGKS